MTQRFLGGTNRRLAVQFSERKRFRKFLLESGYDFLDTLQEMSLYGFVNRDYEVIAPTPDLKTFGDYSSGVEGLTFVVNQFNQFRDHYLQKAEEGNYTVPALIAGLIPTVSYVNYEDSYSAYLEGYKNIVIEKLVSLRRGSVSFRQFIDLCNEMAFDIEVLGMPSTKSGFMLSLESSVYNTGIYIDLGPGLSPELDQQKAEFIEDEGFKCFMEMSNKFGFYIDGNYPWRLAVNLGSPYTRTLLLNGRPPTVFENFYSDTFTMKVSRDDYWSLVKLYKEMYIIYNQLAGVRTLENFSTPIDTKVWIETLLLAKFRELGLMRTVEKTDFFKKTFQDSLDIHSRYRLSSISGVIGFINNFCSTELKNKILGQP